MTTEFELLTPDTLGPQTKRLFEEALERFEQCITPAITSDAKAEPVLTRLLNELMEASLADSTSVFSLALEHPAVFFARLPRSRPSGASLSPALLSRQNVREWLDYELWAKWYLVNGLSSARALTASNRPIVPDLLPDYYIAVDGNHLLYLRYYAETVQSDDWWFVELVIDYSTHDHALTFGPLSREDLISAIEALRGTYCMIYENWDGPEYVGDRLRRQKEKEGDNAEQS